MLKEAGVVNCNVSEISQECKGFLDDVKKKPLFRFNQNGVDNEVRFEKGISRKIKYRKMLENGSSRREQGSIWKFHFLFFFELCSFLFQALKGWGLIAILFLVLLFLLLKWFLYV